MFFDSYDLFIRASVRNWWPDYPDWLWWKAQLYQESQFDPAAHSGAGASGLAQFMPETWAQISRELGYDDVDARSANYAIDAGAYYMAKLRRIWSSPRPADDRQALAQASYNTGAGNVLRAQKLCAGARNWPAIAPCLHLVTGPDADQTLTYVDRIALWHHQLEAAQR